jgi:glutamine synthetase
VFAADGAADAAAQYNLEYRVADATASPYMALGALVHAGVDGIRQRRVLPEVPASGFLAMTDAERDASGARRLPATLAEALGALAATEAAPGWFGARFFDVYRQFKESEMGVLAGLEPAEICARYAAAY